MSGAGPNTNNGNANGDDNGNGFESTSLNRLLKAVVDQRRRNVLYTLENRGDDVTPLDELADEITSQDTEFDETAKVRMTLHHKDLPKLDEFGLLEYDSRSGTIRYRGGNAIGDFLDHLQGLED